MVGTVLSYYLVHHRWDDAALLFMLASNNKGFPSLTMKDLLQIYYSLLGTASLKAELLMPHIEI